MARPEYVEISEPTHGMSSSPTDAFIGFDSDASRRDRCRQGHRSRGRVLAAELGQSVAAWDLDRAGLEVLTAELSKVGYKW